MQSNSNIQEAYCNPQFDAQLHAGCSAKAISTTFKPASSRSTPCRQSHNTLYPTLYYPKNTKNTDFGQYSYGYYPLTYEPTGSFFVLADTYIYGCRGYINSILNKKGSSETTIKNGLFLISYSSGGGTEKPYE